MTNNKQKQRETISPEDATPEPDKPIIYEEFSRILKGLYPKYSFSIDEGNQYGRSDSAHGVFHGTLICPDGTEQKVSIKPFGSTAEDPEVRSKKAIERAKGEALNYKKVKERGFESLTSLDFGFFEEDGRQDGSNTHEPLVINISPNKEIMLPSNDSMFLQCFLLSETREGLSPMNGRNWQTNPDDGLEHSENLELLGKIANFTAEMHASGIMHSDWQLKNIVLDESGNFILVDLEKAKIHGGNGNNKISLNTDESQPARDLRVLVYSLWDMGFMPAMSSKKDFIEAIQKSIINPYIKKLETRILELHNNSKEKAISLVKKIENAIYKDLEKFSNNDRNSQRFRNIGQIATSEGLLEETARLDSGVKS